MSIVVMWQHNVYYVCVTFSVVRYVGLCPTYSPHWTSRNKKTLST